MVPGKDETPLVTGYLEGHPEMHWDLASQMVLWQGGREDLRHRCPAKASDLLGWRPQVKVCPRRVCLIWATLRVYLDWVQVCLWQEAEV